MSNPAAKLWTGEAESSAEAADGGFPYVCTTYRVTEHWQTGVMTRHCPWLLELQPQLFVEMSLELAREEGIRPGDPIRILSKRGELKAIAIPTPRLKVLTVQGKEVHQVGLPWCFGWLMPADGAGGDSANLLTPDVGDPNTMIPETKTFMVNIRKLQTSDLPRLALRWEGGER
jgi:formate dehydrogenase major subunit